MDHTHTGVTATTHSLKTENFDSEELYRKGLEILNRKYGYSGFRPGQWKAIESVLSGRDVVVLMPTGGGKSLCFQMAALMSEGCCLVVTPLLALMKDQVQSLLENGIMADSVNSLRPEADNRAAYARAAEGHTKILYLSPERLVADLDRIRKTLKVSFVAVDEAHCISKWGHDFRPVYTSLGRIKECWPDIPVMALTATADRLTRDDIATALSLRDPYMYIGSFDRPNLSLRVVEGSRLEDRVATISSLIGKYEDDCGIVYCLSRKKAEKMAERLSGKGFRVGCYHAGLPAEQREQTQREFVEGRLQAICATVAFGMGIDKSNVRWVVHNNIPGDVESYYQEIGRAGRDGMPAETILFYSYGDIMTRRKFAEESGQRVINESKLSFMQRYAEASVCRRRILLSYFSEETSCDCGNCDNCLSPRPRFDGTILARKALSAIVRCKGKESIGHIIEILRGNRNQNIQEHGYHLLPTFGVGVDTGPNEWHAYILQMIQLGLIEVAYEENFHLRCTPLGMKVLKGTEKIDLVRSTLRRLDFSSKKGSNSPTSPTLSFDELLTQALKELRTKLVRTRDIPDYMVFSDATIADIVRKKPKSVDELSKVEGMGLIRLSLYYKDILSTVKKTLLFRDISLIGLTADVSRIMYVAGMPVDEIAQTRKLKVSTIVSHLISFLDDGLSIKFEDILAPDRFEEAMRVVAQYNSLKDETDVASQENRDLMSRICERCKVSSEELYKARAIAKAMEVVDGRYVRLPISVEEPPAAYGEDIAVDNDADLEPMSDLDQLPDLAPISEHAPISDSPFAMTDEEEESDQFDTLDSDDVID